MAEQPRIVTGLGKAELHRILVRGYDRCDYTISASPALDAWAFWVDRDGSQEHGVVTGAEHVLRLKARLETEIAHLKTLGWVEPATEEWT